LRLFVPLMTAALIGCGNADKDDKTKRPKPVETDTSDTDTDTDTTVDTPPKRAVVLMVGDGMGPEHVKAGAWWVNGAEDGLVIQSLPVQGQIRTANYDGIGDSASCGTAMAAGPHTWNGAIGMDRDYNEVESVLEVAASQGWGTGVVTTSETSHATPAVFTAHHDDRNAQNLIAALQLDSPVDILLGGGWQFIYGQEHIDSMRGDDGLLGEMEDRGISWVDTTAALDAGPDLPIFGAFSKAHLVYVANRTDEDIPSLASMATTALERLQDHPSLFLVVEGARIDHASHGNKIEFMVDEMRTFDEAIQAVLDWAETTEHELTLVVTADHETGGLEVVSGNAAGVLPDVTWHWGNHTNRDVPVYGLGPGTDVFDGQLLDQAWVHSVLHHRVTDSPAVVAPEDWILPDGRLDDLDHRPTTQVNTSPDGDDISRLEALEIDADADGLSIGLEGLFPWQTHTVSIVMDVDFGAGTGPAQLAGYVTDVDHPVDLTISQLKLLAPPAAVNGFGIDLVVVSQGGVETPYLQLFRGLRGLHGDFGDPANLATHKVGMNYGTHVRTEPTAPLSVVPGEGFEAYIPWSAIWPDLGGGVPPNTQIALAAIVSDIDGLNLSNQALPPFPIGTNAPGPSPAPIPGVVVFPIDDDGDGIASGTTSPFVLP